MKPAKDELDKDGRQRVYPSDLHSIVEGNQKLTKKYKFCKEPTKVNKVEPDPEPKADENIVREEEGKEEVKEDVILSQVSNSLSLLS